VLACALDVVSNFPYFWGSCASHSVANVMVKHAVVGQDSHAIGTWKDVHWSLRVLPIYHPRRRVRFCVVEEPSCVTIMRYLYSIDLVVFTVVGEDLFHCDSFEPNLCVKRSRPSITSRSTQTRYQIVRFLHRPALQSFVMISTQRSK